MDEIIRHEGIVLSTSGELAHVEIVQTSACAACKARSMCMSSESQQKYIDAVMLEPMKTGDRVEVEVRERLAWKAILLAYILPFVVMMAVIAVLDYAVDYLTNAVYRDSKTNVVNRVARACGSASCVGDADNLTVHIEQRAT